MSQTQYIKVYTVKKDNTNVLVIESSNEFFNNVVNGLLFLINAFDRVKLGVEEIQKAVTNFNKLVEDFFKNIIKQWEEAQRTIFRT